MKIRCEHIQIIPDFNCRRNYEPQHCIALADNIKEYGLLQPIVVRKTGDLYQVIAGHRRFVAVAQVLGWEEIETTVVEADDEKAQRINFIENIERSDLTLMEEARALRKMFPRRIDYKIMGKCVGRSELWCRVRWEINDLPEFVIEKIEDGTLNATDAQALIASSPDDAAELIRAKEAGESSRKAAKRIRDRRASRSRTDILKMNARLMGDGLRVDCYRAFAWAAGEISDAELLSEATE